MGQPRGAHKIMTATATSSGGVTSSGYAMGERTDLTVLVRNTDGANVATCQIQLAAGEGSSGLNNTPASTEWCTLLKDDGSGVLSFDVAASSQVAINVSPVAAAWLRVLAKDKVAASHATVDVWVQSI